MIEINLLPEEQKARTRKTVSSASPAVNGFDPSYLVYAVPVSIAVLLLTHLYLGSVFLSKQRRLDALNKEWIGLEAQRQKIVNFKAESDVNSQDAQIIDELTTKSIRWSEKLNRLSLDLPPGIWFNDIAISRKTLEIKASVFSLESNGVDLINKFLLNLKNDKDFINSFVSVETGNMVTKKLGSYEVMDFTVTGTLKSAK
jgi:Tfp pilus assembly protein PilN